MKAVLGIGNPGSRYNNTRHNIGFHILDRFADKHKLLFKESEYDYVYAGGELNTSPFFLIKPTTYVNLSGLAAVDLCDHYDIPPENLLVVVDDVNLNLGKLRVRKAGSDGGHNGLKSIIYHLVTDNFPRLRFGIGSDFEKGDMADFVLSKFDSDEKEEINPAINNSIELIEHFITGDFTTMLNHFSKLGSASSNTS